MKKRKRIQRFQSTSPLLLISSSNYIKRVKLNQIHSKISTYVI